ncbi:hypothetical protein M2134_002451 [Parabacteroides sp. PM6-13]|nr:hypothetical protein [Parabacteroides sp. PM6-13]
MWAQRYNFLTIYVKSETEALWFDFNACSNIVKRAKHAVFFLFAIILHLEESKPVLHSPFFFIIFSIANPSNPPKRMVIIVIGINEIGSCQPIRMALGINAKKAISIPFAIGLICKSIVAIKNPTTTHIVNAERLASQVRFCTIIGITSKIPAAIPNSIPILILFVFM